MLLLLQLIKENGEEFSYSIQLLPEEAINPRRLMELAEPGFNVLAADMRGELT